MKSLSSSMPTLARLVNWWLGEMSAAFNELTRKRFSRRRDAILITVADGTATFERRSDGDTTRLGTASLGSPNLPPALRAAMFTGNGARATMVLRLPSSQGLFKMLAFPVAVEKDLAQVLSFEVTRQTPFRIDQVYYDYEITNRNNTTGKVETRLTVIPKSAVDDELELFGNWDLSPEVIELVADDGQAEASIRLKPDGETPADTKHRAIRHPILIGAAIVLVIVLGALPMLGKSGLKAELSAQIEAVRAEAEEAAAMREQIRTLMGRNSFLHSKKQQVPVMTVMLDEVTRLLPDDTWLNRVEIKNRELQIWGNSPQASALIGILEQSRYLSEVQFRSPVTRDERALNERFHISATVAPGILR